MVWLRSWTMAMTWMTRLICRFPARESRCRTRSPEEASIGGVPFQEAKWALDGNRSMPPISTSRRAAPLRRAPGCRGFSSHEGGDARPVSDTFGCVSRLAHERRGPDRGRRQTVAWVRVTGTHEGEFM